MATNKIINQTDRIYATILHHGLTVANLTISGVTSFSSAIRKIITSVGKTSGLVTIVLRNTTQGWTQRHSINLTNAYIQTATSVSGMQLTLF